MVRPSRRQRYYADDDDDDAEDGGQSFDRHSAVHHYPQHTLYGSTAAAAASQSEDRGPSVDAGEPSSGVLVAGRRHRSRRGHRPHVSQTQSNVEDV